MAAGDPLLDPPSWAPSWLSIDNVRTVRRFGYTVTALIFLTMGACVIESAGEPADPTLVPDQTIVVPEISGASTTAPQIEGCPTSATGPEGSTLALVNDLGTATARIEFSDGTVQEYCVLVADEPEERGRGLMGVTDFAVVEGMLFIYPEPTTNPFFMFQTPTPLSITWWAADGTFVSRRDMPPCLEAEGGDCEQFPPAGPYTAALELPQDIGSDLVPVAGDRLSIVMSPGAGG